MALVPRAVLVTALLASACASLGRGDELELEFDDGGVGAVVAPPVPREARLAWDEPADDRTTTAWTEPGDLPQLLAPDGHALPLRLTDVHADVRGHIADVVVTQHFVNDRDTPIEVVYTFPLPENAAVTDMRMVIGERVIESVVQRRAEARASYEAAREEGHTAALLEQERPNVFTQSVANIDAGAEIDVEIHYLQTLSFDAGSFELVFPMVVGPRYSPGVRDAARISPPIVGHGMRAGDDIAIAVDLEAGARIETISAPNHDVDIDRRETRVHVELAHADERPNRDFVLRWRPTGNEVRSTLFVGPTDARGSGHFELLLSPPALDVDALIGRRELVFVLDVSGSMYGLPLALEKALLRTALSHLRPVDTFNVVTFASTSTRLFEHAQAANTARIDEALRFVDALEAGGGTEMDGGVELALVSPIPRGRTRYVLFMTDGEIGGEA
ncbi:MAG TPA: VIT domain-containing protein, partial [Nannocystaceae bacterium]|nr:VIT domain-containing protein [Nannocystaceae bacterium]